MIALGVADEVITAARYGDAGICRVNVAPSAITVWPTFSSKLDRRIISATDIPGRVTSTPCDGGPADPPSNSEAAKNPPWIAAGNAIVSPSAQMPRSARVISRSRAMRSRMIGRSAPAHCVNPANTRLTINGIAEKNRVRVSAKKTIFAVT